MAGRPPPPTRGPAPHAASTPPFPASERREGRSQGRDGLTPAVVLRPSASEGGAARAARPESQGPARDPTPAGERKARELRAVRSRCFSTGSPRPIPRTGLSPPENFRKEVPEMACGRGASSARSPVTISALAPWGLQGPGRGRSEKAGGPPVSSRWSSSAPAGIPETRLFV